MTTQFKGNAQDDNEEHSIRKLAAEINAGQPQAYIDGWISGYKYAMGEVDRFIEDSEI